MCRRAQTHFAASKCAAGRWSPPDGRRFYRAYGLATALSPMRCYLRTRRTGKPIMIRTIVDFALNKRLLILAAAALLTVWGVVSFHNLPVEAYPDVASN